MKNSGYTCEEFVKKPSLRLTEGLIWVIMTVRYMQDR